MHKKTQRITAPHDYNLEGHREIAKAMSVHEVSNILLGSITMTMVLKIIEISIIHHVQENLETTPT